MIGLNAKLQVWSHKQKESMIRLSSGAIAVVTGYGYGQSYGQKYGGTSNG